MPVTTYDAGATAVDLLLAGAAVALLGSAARVVVHSRRASTVRLFGRTLYRPRLWAAGAACMGFYVLLGLGSLTEVTPGAWRTSSRWISAVLLLAALALMVTHGILDHRARRRIGRERQLGPRRGPAGRPSSM
ncbi:hypothetical protein AB0J51_29560 [Micromonospora echinofusca]|uniref:hypothetical protein n=1 Tax=Micromonospora echinofusca TaxID=47858 RepID=UPI003425DAAA